MPPDDPRADRFRIDARVVFKLGEDLITDEVQALLELVKNSYDADATFAAVTIDTRSGPDLVFAHPTDSPGFIRIEDDGTGMDRQDIRDGWLLIGDSRKRRQKEAGETTPRGRTPLGDKGLGRLGAQRLGWGLEISTKTPAAKDELVVGFSWEDFETAPTLDQVAVDVAHRRAHRKQGTTLTISGLRDANNWRGDENLAALQKELSQLISPYQDVADFLVTLTVDGVPLDLQTLSRQVRDTAQLHYDIEFDGDRLVIRASARLGFFRPQSGKDLDAFRQLVDGDGGQAFLTHLRSAKRTRDLRLRAGSRGWFVLFSRERLLRGLDPALVPEGLGSNEDSRRPGPDEMPSGRRNRADRTVDEPVRLVPANPGPFHAEVDSFDLGSGSDDRLEVFGSLKPYRDFIKEMSGVRVYRDGFGVRVDKDWLGLGAQWTSATSYYGLKPENTMGYVAITSRDNPQLVEKTDREGFKDTPYYQNFRALLGEFVKFTTEVQGALRREWIDFRKANLKAAAEVDESSTPESVTADIDAALAEASSLRHTVAAARETAARSIALADDAESDGTAPPEVTLQRSQEATAELRTAARETDTALQALATYLERLSSAQRKAEVLRVEIASLRDQLAQSVETMSLGLTAEALSHEMFQVADGLATRTAAIRSHITATDLDDKDVLRYVEHVRAAISTLRTELAHFAPSLRFVRERRQIIEVPGLVDDVGGYFQRRWETQIRLRIDHGRGRFVVRSSRGKLVQVLDNLLLNSEYWLSVAVKQQTITDPQVHIELRRPVIRIWDNGPGVDPSAENSLFEPFVTRKPRGQGRGLGLFVCRQLLESEGASIDLSASRNKEGRRFRFDVDLSSVLYES